MSVPVVQGGHGGEEGTYRRIEGHSVIAAWAERCAGPGWSNQLVNVITMDQWGGLHRHYLQPAEQTLDMLLLFDVSATAAEVMRKAVERAVGERGVSNEGAGVD